MHELTNNAEESILFEINDEAVFETALATLQTCMAEQTEIEHSHKVLA